MNHSEALSFAEQCKDMDETLDAAPLFLHRTPVQEYSATQAAGDAEVCKEALTRLGYEPHTMATKSFNDDDYYIYNPLTLEFKAHYTHRERHRLIEVGPGLAADKGMRAKHLGLWRLIDKSGW